MVYPSYSVYTKVVRPRRTSKNSADILPPTHWERKPERFSSYLEAHTAHTPDQDIIVSSWFAAPCHTLDLAIGHRLHVETWQHESLEDMVWSMQMMYPTTRLNLSLATLAQGAWNAEMYFAREWSLAERYDHLTELIHLTPKITDTQESVRVFARQMALMHLFTGDYPMIDQFIQVIQLLTFKLL